MSPSPLMISLQTHITNLESDLIVVGKSYDKYTRQDHFQADAYTVLSAAVIEHFVEKRCEEISQVGLDRLERQLPSSTGRALIVWYFTRDGRRTKNQLPVQQSDMSANQKLRDDILDKYRSLVKSNHGVAGDKLRNLIYPLGVREHQIPEILINKLDDLSEQRNRIAHNLKNRAKSLEEPKIEIDRVKQVLDSLMQLDTDLQHVVENYPVT